MKNDYFGGGVKISIPPTVLYSVLGVMDDVNRAVTSDFKQPGDKVYLLGDTFRELGGSEIADQLNTVGAQVPQVDALSAMARYRALHGAINAGLVTACHDLSDGGLAVALAEMAVGGRLGARCDIAAVPVVPGAADAADAGDMTAAEVLYSESASRLLVTVKPENAAAFEARFAGSACACIGEVTADAVLTVTAQGAPVLAEDVEGLARSFKATFDW